MMDRVVEPFVRLIGRWRMERTMAHLGAHLCEDAGLEVGDRLWDEISIAKRSFWTGRRRK